MATDPNNIPASQFYHTKPGLWNANSYISSGLPFITGSVISGSNFGTNNAEMRVSFPYVTRTVTVINRSSTDLRIHFNSLSDSQHVVTHRHYVSLTENRDSITFNVKCKEVFISLANSGSNGDFVN